jgi:hypothetical protein
MPFDIASVGAQAANDVLNTGLGLLLENHNDKRQLRQQQKLQNLQINGAIDLTDYQQQKQLEMWEKTGYGPQMEQLRKAGLNPALLYGMKGGGGMTIGSGVVQPQGGGNAPSGGQEIQNMLGMALMKANIEKTKAETNKTNAEANNLGSVKENIESQTGVNKSTIQLIEQQTDNERAKWDLMRADKALKDLEIYAKEQTQEATIDEIRYKSRTAYELLLQAQNNTKIQNSTMDSAIKEINANATGAVLKNKLTEWNISITPQLEQKLRYEITNLFEGNMRAWDMLSQEHIKNLHEDLKNAGINLDESNIKEVITILTGVLIGKNSKAKR